MSNKTQNPIQNTPKAQPQHSSQQMFFIEGNEMYDVNVWACPVKGCLSRFAMKGDLKYHVRHHHPGSLDLLFQKYPSLSRARSSKANKTWSCPVDDCPCGYARLCDMKNHFVLHHPDQLDKYPDLKPKKILRCPFCNAIFGRKHMRRQHVVKNHGKDKLSELDAIEKDEGDDEEEEPVPPKGKQKGKNDDDEDDEMDGGRSFQNDETEEIITKTPKRKAKDSDLEDSEISGGRGKRKKQKEETLLGYDDNSVQTEIRVSTQIRVSTDNRYSTETRVSTDTNASIPGRPRRGSKSSFQPVGEDSKKNDNNGNNNNTLEGTPLRTSFDGYPNQSSPRLQAQTQSIPQPVAHPFVLQPSPIYANSTMSHLLHPIRPVYPVNYPHYHNYTYPQSEGPSIQIPIPVPVIPSQAPSQPLIPTPLSAPPVSVSIQTTSHTGDVTDTEQELLSPLEASPEVLTDEELAEQQLLLPIAKRTRVNYLLNRY